MKNDAYEQIYEVKYTGYLTNANDMYLHYGYTNWSNVSEKKMKKLKSCYKIEVAVPAGDELNFCFRANENEWDNNSGNNYWFAHGSSKSYACVEITGKESADNETKAKTSTKAKSTSAKTATAKANVKSTSTTSKVASTTKKVATKKTKN